MFGKCNERKWLSNLFPCLRAGPFHPSKVQSSQPFAPLSGSFKQQSPQKQSPLSSWQKPNASLPPLTNGLHSAGPKSPKSSSNLSSSAQEPNLNSHTALTVAEKKKKKKKKRRHSEMQSDTEPITPPPPTPPANAAKSADERKQKKKKKKRKREMENGEKETERECVASHLDTSNQEEDWCQAGMWSLAPNTNGERSEQKTQLAATTPKQPESDQKEWGQDSLKKKKKKKKKMKLMKALQNMPSAGSASERWVDIYDYNHFSHGSLKLFRTCYPQQLAPSMIELSDISKYSPVAACEPAFLKKNITFSG